MPFRVEIVDVLLLPRIEYDVVRNERFSPAKADKIHCKRQILSYFSPLFLDGKVVNFKREKCSKLLLHESESIE